MWDLSEERLGELWQFISGPEREMNEINNVAFYLTEAVCALPFESEMKAAQELVLTALKLRILIYEQFRAGGV